MEFVGNQINLKSVLATLTVAFFVGRIQLFDGTFPAAIALITVMAAVSTVYIYLVPVMAAGMLTFSGQGLDFYGDLMAMVFCGIFFLFFHKQRFTTVSYTHLLAKPGKGTLILALLISLDSLILGQLPFDRLVGAIYPYTGYLGMVLLACLARYRLRRRRRNEANGGER